MSDIVEIKSELAELRKKIRKYSKQYYDANASDISDYDFDMLMQRLKGGVSGAHHEEFSDAEGGGDCTARGRRTRPARCPHALSAGRI